MTVERPTKQRLPKPEWLKVRFPAGERYHEIMGLLREHNLHTVCEEADCPNIGECFNAGEATFIILGDVCTRSCGFCSVTSGRPEGLDLLEPYRLAQTVDTLGLDYAVITSVNRDDLPDGGASIWAACIRAIRQRRPQCEVEILTPDFEGNWEALQTVVEAGPAVYNHNLETVPRLYRHVRPKAVYERSLELLWRVKQIDPTMPTKSGIMVGLGETLPEVQETMADLRAHGVDLLTVGQYLQPDSKHLPVARYWHPDEYAAVREIGARLGFAHVEAGPFVRSSYHAREQARAANVGSDNVKLRDSSRSVESLATSPLPFPHANRSALQDKSSVLRDESRSLGARVEADSTESQDDSSALLDNSGNLGARVEARHASPLRFFDSDA